MPDTQLVAVLLLLVVAVMFGYFYFKRAQRRDHPVTPTKVEYPTESPAATGSASTATPTSTPAASWDDAPRRDVVDDR